MPELQLEFGTGQAQRKECFLYAKTNNLAVFQRDLNPTQTKQLVADTYANVFNEIKNCRRNNWYEFGETSQPMKLYIDYDKKEAVEDLKKRKNNDHHVNHKTDILNIINTIRTLIPNITGVSILKSIPNIEKKSYHIIFDGIHFPNKLTIKKFVEEQLSTKFKELLDNKIIDVKVYGNLCFRTLLSTKSGQNRPLYLLDTNAFLSELQENIVTKEDTTYEQFLKCSITHIEEDSVLYAYKSEKKKNTSKKIHLMNEEDIYTDKEIVKKYLDILDPDRYTDYNKWLNIGFILYSINNDYIDLWHYFSSKWENYDEEICNSKWNSFANSEYIYTINNLIYLSKVDNLGEYEELSSEIPNHDIKYLRPFDNVLSKLIYRLYGERFVCSNPEKNEWYFFNGIRWKKENKSYNLRKKITDEVFTKVENYRRQLIKEGASDDLIKNYHNILLKLGSGIKLNCLELEFYNSDFYKIIDQNKDLLGFDNGILDLKTMEFRKGVSSDYVSMSVGYDYTNIQKEELVYIELMELIKKILPIDSVREFTLKALASCLDGHNRDENFYIFTGMKGANGKSTITDLLLKTLGEYGCISPVSLITGKRETSNSANSALFNIQNKRVVIMQEPSVTETIQADTLKSLTGGDRISTRELNSTQIEFIPHAKFCMCCNKLSLVSDMDGGVARRIKIVSFDSRFVEEPTEEFEYKIDKELKNKLDSYKNVFMCILRDYYVLYRSEGLPPPDEVVKITNKYELNNNNIKMFIDENIVTGNKSDTISKEELKEIYRNDYNLKSSFPKFNIFLSQLEIALNSEIKLDKKRVAQLYGYCLRRNLKDDDDSEEKCELD